MRHGVVLCALLLAMPVQAQSMRECRNPDGSSYLTQHQCATPQPYAGVVRKCVGPGTAVSFQQSPCPAGSRQALVRDATPEAPLTAAQRQQRAEKAERERQESAYLSRLADTDWIDRPVPVVRRSHTPDARDRQRAACEAARANRATVLANTRDQGIELLDALNSRVYAACQGL